MQKNEAGKWTVHDHHRLFTVDVRQRRQKQRLQTAGDFRYFPFLKGGSQRVIRTGAGSVPAEPSGRTETGSSADVVRPA